MIVNGMSKSSKIIRCKLCDYTTSRKSQYDRHILTLKHQNKQNDSSKSSKSSKNECICDCGRHLNMIVAYIVTKKNVIILNH